MIVNVPRMPELSVKSLIDLAYADEQIRQYLPEITGKKILNRQYLFNVINTAQPDFFPNNVRELMHNKNQEIAMKKQKFINIRPEFL
jgi:hypothetical protein